ncbi:MAG: hypothetical protein ACRDYZ_02305 [Acidimicrobiales bacterium]
MAQRRWINQSQPQTLQGAVLFSYFNAALALIYALLLGAGSSLLYLPVLLLAVSAYGIANDKKLGYWSGVVLACLNVLGVLAILVLGGGFGGILNLLFAGILVVLLLHPDSRAYQHNWFR